MSRRYSLMACALLAGFSFEAHCADSVPLVIEARIELGAVRGRIDHLAVDLKHQRLYVAELGNDSVGVVDLATGKVVRTLTGFSEPQGIGYEPASDTLYVANARDGSVRLFQGGDLTSLGTIALGADADNVRIDEKAAQVWVGYASGALAVIDAGTRHKIADISLPGHPESFRLEPGGSLIFVNVPDAREIAVVDRTSNKQVAAWKMGMTLGNFPLALDERSHRSLLPRDERLPIHGEALDLPRRKNFPVRSLARSAVPRCQGDVRHPGCDMGHST